MDSPADRYNNFISRYGAGFDAAGRPSYSGPGVMYMGPGEFSKTQAVQKDLEAKMQESERERQLRFLLDRLARESSAGKTNIPVFPLSGPNSVSYHLARD